jgi:hypothetical protein
MSTAALLAGWWRQLWPNVFAVSVWTVVLFIWHHLSIKNHITVKLDEHHTSLKNHLTETLNAHHEDLKKHITAAARKP